MNPYDGEQFVIDTVMSKMNGEISTQKIIAMELALNKNLGMPVIVTPPTGFGCAAIIRVVDFVNKEIRSYIPNFKKVD